MSGRSLLGSAAICSAQLGAIADRCGWKSPTVLRTYFEKRFGMTLREWRNRNAAS